MAGACHECHLPLGTPHLYSQRAQVQVEGKGPKVRVLCSVRDSQPVTGPWGPLPKKFVVSPLLAAPERKSTLVLS